MNSADMQEFRVEIIVYSILVRAEHSWECKVIIGDDNFFGEGYNAVA